MGDTVKNSFPKSYHLNFVAFQTCDVAMAAYGTALGVQTLVDSQSSFNHFCRQACALWQQHFPEGRGESGKLTADLWTRLKAGGESIISTSWGGVVVEQYQHPKVEKFLVIRKGGYLALETHSQKSEHLEICQGTGLLLVGEVGSDQLSVCALTPGMSFDFAPEAVHCLIGTENLTVYETSTDPLGMDQDLVFLYTPE